VDAGPNQTVKVGETVQFNGSASDPDGDALATIQWSFGDNTTATGSFTPSHVYTTVGVYTVVLSVTDSRSATGSDNLTVTVYDPDSPPVEFPIFLPLIMGGGSTPASGEALYLPVITNGGTIQPSTSESQEE
jgi:PKD repeat protein